MDFLNCDDIEKMKGLVLFECYENYFRVLECQATALSTMLTSPDSTQRMQAKISLEFLKVKQQIILDLKNKL